MGNHQALKVSVHVEHLPLKSVFRIARGAKTQADVIVVTLSDGQYLGWAESVPYGRYNETLDSVVTQINTFISTLSSANDFETLLADLPPGAAKNVLDCALWDLRAKQKRTSVSELLSLSPAQPCVTAQTLSIDTPEAMAKAVQAMENPPLVKVKLDNQDIIEKMIAISQAAPHSQFIVDANEGWSLEDLETCCYRLAELNVILIEQPLPSDQDQALIDFDSPIPLCADESCHTRCELEYLVGRYQVINIKLDKTGGLTEAVALLGEAKNKGFDIMLGCMVGSSLAMAPISLLVNEATFVDLDGPLLIAKDRCFGFEFDCAMMEPVSPSLWGSALGINYSPKNELA